MNIILCLKAARADYVYQNEHRNEKYVISPYDLYELQYLADMKKKYDFKLICLLMGPEETKEVLTKCYALGADKCILLNDMKFAGSDTLASSYILSKAIKKMEDYSIVICGKKSMDGETGQVPLSLGERLHISYITNVTEISDLSANTVEVTQHMNQWQKKVKATLPVLMTFNVFTTVMNSISLINLKQAQRKQCIKWTADDIEIDHNKCGTKGSMTQVLSIQPVEGNKVCQFVSIKPDDASSTFVKLLKEYL